MNDEMIMLLNAAGGAIGTAPKVASHHQDTPLHLAFSCYLVDDAGQVLITQRAHHKHTWPSVWTNSCCGHPAPGETLRDAVQRRAHSELGVSVAQMTLVLPSFRYRAEMANHVVENEYCPVVRAVPVGPLRLNPSEVAEAEWRSWDECRVLAASPGASPWFRDQMAELAALGNPLAWRSGAPDELPAAIAW